MSLSYDPSRRVATRRDHNWNHKHLWGRLVEAMSHAKHCFTLQIAAPSEFERGAVDTSKTSTLLKCSSENWTTQPVDISLLKHKSRSSDT